MGGPGEEVGGTMTPGGISGGLVVHCGWVVGGPLWVVVGTRRQAVVVVGGRLVVHCERLWGRGGWRGGGRDEEVGVCKG